MYGLRVVLHATFLALSNVSYHSLISSNIVTLFQCVICFSTLKHCFTDFFFWDSINGIWFIHANVYQCMCKAGQSVINLKFNLDGKDILNLFNIFIVESHQVVPRRSLCFVFLPLPRIVDFFTWQDHSYTGWAISDTSECEGWLGWSRNSYLKYLWPLGHEKVATVQYQGPLGHNSIRISREMSLGRQNSNFPPSSHGPRRDTVKVNIAPEFI